MCKPCSSTALLFLAVAAGSASADRAQAEMGALVPAYFYPVAGSPWDDLVDAAETIPVTAILNPASGPGSAPDSNYVTAVDALRAAGGSVVGYVHSSWGDRPMADVVAEIDRYANWYAIDGIFVDEMSTSTAASTLDYYAEVYGYAKGVDPQWQVIGNPGVQSVEAYLSRPVADILVVSEDAGSAYPAYTPSAWNFDYRPEQIAHLVHDVGDQATMESYVQLAASRNTGWLFITDDSLPNPWDTLPEYWNAEVAALRAAEPGGSPAESLTTRSKVVPDGGIHIAPGDADRTDWDAVPWFPIDQVDAAGPEVDYQRVAVANDSEQLFFRFLLNQSEPFGWRHHVLIDADQDRTTGFVGNGNFLSIGVDYMLEGPTLYAFSGQDPEAWKWTEVATSPWDATPTTDIETTVARAAIGNPAQFDFLVYAANSGAEDFYPNGSASSVGGEMFTYLVGQLGDMDRDGDIDFDDIDPFVAGLNDPVDYELTHGVPPSASGDLDQDGDHDFDDIPRFAALLAAVPRSEMAPVPEPATLRLAALAVLSVCGWLRMRRSCSMRRGRQTVGDPE